MMSFSSKRIDNGIRLRLLLWCRCDWLLRWVATFPLWQLQMTLWCFCFLVTTSSSPTFFFTVHTSTTTSRRFFLPIIFKHRYIQALQNVVEVIADTASKSQDGQSKGEGAVTDSDGKVEFPPPTLYNKVNPKQFPAPSPNMAQMLEAMDKKIESLFRRTSSEATGCSERRRGHDTTK
jgi:hypothetical protein